MSFDLVVIGGTGQWFLLELCLRRRRDRDPQAAPFPDAIWLVDRDLSPINEPPGAERVADQDLAAALARELSAIGEIDEDPGRFELSRIACQPALHRVTHLQGLLASPELADVAWIATSQKERNIDVRRGFFALPRLSAIWTSIQGFEGQGAVVDGEPSFLQRSFLEPAGESPQPLVVVGSLAGGTGAGLLPYFYQRLRDAPARSWRRPVVILAVLPWFQPPREGAGQFATISWERCCRNARSGIRALHRLSRDLQRRAIEEGSGQLPAGLPSTTCVLAGPQIREAKALPVSDLVPGAAVRRGYIAASIQLLADGLVDLIGSGHAQDQRRAFSFGTLQARVTEISADSLVDERGERYRLGLVDRSVERLERAE